MSTIEVRDLKKLSYLSLVEIAIRESAQKRLTLNEIYTWFEQNVPEKLVRLGENGKNDGWKVILSHNHKFKQFNNYKMNKIKFIKTLTIKDIQNIIL